MAVQVGDSTIVGGGAHRGDSVEQFVVVDSGLAGVGGGHLAPLVPGEHLDLVKRREVLHEVASDLARAEVAGPVDAESRGIDVTAAVRGPCLAAGEEVAGPKVVGVLDDVPAEDLRIDTNPTSFRDAPVLNDPVAEALARLEIGGEAAPDSAAPRNASGERS